MVRVWCVTIHTTAVTAWAKHLASKPWFDRDDNADASPLPHPNAASQRCPPQQKITLGEGER